MTVTDNNVATLDGARSDAAYAEISFLFLGLPGEILAASRHGLVDAGRGR